MENILKTLLKNYMDDVEGVVAISICDRDGLIMASITKEGLEEDTDTVIGAISASLENYIARVKNEFGTESSFFNITIAGDRKFAHCSKGTNNILTTVAELSASDIKIKVYSEHVAGKVDLMLNSGMNTNISLKIPSIVRALSDIRDGRIPEGTFSTKLILIGDHAVGKTSLIRRFVQNKFEEDYISTIGVEILKKDVNLTEKTHISFLLWDIGGQTTQMAPYRKRFYTGANSALLVIDRTKSNVEKSIEFWAKDLKEVVFDDIPIVLVGNKSDLSESIVVTEERIKEIAKKYGFYYIVTSAKTGLQVDDAFYLVAYSILKSY